MHQTDDINDGYFGSGQLIKAAVKNMGEILLKNVKKRKGQDNRSKKS